MIIVFTLIWALIFGVNINGKHYGIDCGFNGVDVHMGDKQ